MQNEDLKITEDLEKNFEQLSNVSIDSKSAEFLPLIEDIESACELLDFDSEADELKFRAWLKETFLKMKQYSEK